MIITSLKTNEEVIQSNQTFFPSIVMWSNYVYVFSAFKFLTYLMEHGCRGLLLDFGDLNHDDLGWLLPLRGLNSRAAMRSSWSSYDHDDPGRNDGHPTTSPSRASVGLARVRP
jgi:hypothetical protein